MITFFLSPFVHWGTFPTNLLTYPPFIYYIYWFGPKQQQRFLSYIFQDDLMIGVKEASFLLDFLLHKISNNNEEEQGGTLHIFIIATLSSLVCDSPLFGHQTKKPSPTYRSYCKRTSAEDFIWHDSVVAIVLHLKLHWPSLVLTHPPNKPFFIDILSSSDCSDRAQLSFSLCIACNAIDIFTIIYNFDREDATMIGIAYCITLH